MTYIEAHSELRDHPKTKLLKRTLGISLPAAVGHLQCLWWWVMDYAESGDLTGYPSAVIANAAEWDGDPEQFVNALVDCAVKANGSGFLERTPDGRLIVHDWYDYGGKLICRRWVDAYRKRVKRLPSLAELRAADLPLPPDELIPVGWYQSSESKPSPIGASATRPDAKPTVSPSGSHESAGHPTDIQWTSELPPDDRVRSVAKPNVPYPTVENPSSSPPTPQGEDSAAAADANAENSEMDTGPGVPDKLPLPGENPAAYVQRALRLLPGYCAKELQERWIAASKAGRASQEWPWKQRIVVDWISGKEPLSPPPKDFRVRAEAPPDYRNPLAAAAAIAGKSAMNGVPPPPRNGTGPPRPPMIDQEARRKEEECARQWLADLPDEERERISAEEKDYIMGNGGELMNEKLLSKSLATRMLHRAILAVRETNYSARNNPSGQVVPMDRAEGLKNEY